MADFARRRLADVAAALALLTRLPMPSAAPGPQAAWAWPLAGLAVGALAAGAAALAGAVGLPPGVAAGLALAVAALATGGLHEDGLSDSADGLWGGGHPERRLEIMRDSRIGSYGALALVLGLGLRWSALASAIAAGWLWPALLVAGLASRAAMAALAAALPFARPDGLARLTGRPPPRAALAAMALAGAGCLLLAPWALVAVALAAGGLVALLGRVARRRIGGQTGDILGAAQQLAEIAVLLVFAAL
ncbi:adenosylcobinamide-GDP ribazoletransferase [Oceanicola granulosus]